MTSAFCSFSSLSVQDSPASVHPVGEAEVEQHYCAGERPGTHVGETEHRQRVHKLEDRNDRHQ